MRRALRLVRVRLGMVTRSRPMLGPVVAAVLAQVALAGSPGGTPGVAMTLGLVLAMPFAAWAVREVLGAVPDTQADLDALAAGGRGRADGAGLAAGYVVALVMIGAGALLGSFKGLQQDDETGAEFATAVAVAAGMGLLLAIGAAAATTAVGALASRRSAGLGARALALLVGVPVVTIAVGQSESEVVRSLAPRVLPVVEAAVDGRLVTAGAVDAVQMVAWAALLVAARVLWHRWRGHGGPTW